MSRCGIQVCLGLYMTLDSSQTALILQCVHPLIRGVGSGDVIGKGRGGNILPVHWFGRSTIVGRVLVGLLLITT